jgi:hypothetical protein
VSPTLTWKWNALHGGQNGGATREGTSCTQAIKQFYFLPEMYNAIINLITKAAKTYKNIAFTFKMHRKIFLILEKY